jgi:hypothetical protein
MYNLIEDIKIFFEKWDAIIQIIVAIAAPGGIWFWIEKYKNQPRVKFRSASLLNRYNLENGLILNVENVGLTSTRTYPKIAVSGITLNRVKFKAYYKLQDENIKLQPLEVKALIAAQTGSCHVYIQTAWYIKIELYFIHGRPLTIRMRNAEFQQLNSWRFHWERVRFLQKKHS